mgnify:CR=1 FL=1
MKYTPKGKKKVRLTDYQKDMGLDSWWFMHDTPEDKLPSQFRRRYDDEDDDDERYVP